MGKVKKYLLLIVLALFCLINLNCKNQEDSYFEPGIRISPEGKTSCTSDFTLTVKGFGFDSGAKIFFNGREMPTKFISDTRLSCVVPKADISFSAESKIGYDIATDSEAEEVEVYVVSSKKEESYRKKFKIYVTYKFEHVSYLDSLDTGEYNRFGKAKIVVNDEKEQYVVYSGIVSNTKKDFRFSCSIDSGKTWSTPKVLGSIVDDVYYDNSAQIAVSKDSQIVVAFNSHKDNLVICRSSDQGKTWDSKEFAVDDFCAQSIAADENGTIVVAGGNMYRRSNSNASVSTMITRDNGETWSQPVEIGNQLSDDNANPYVVINNNRIMIVYLSSDWHRNNNNIFQASDDYTQSWSQPYNIFTGCPSNAITLHSQNSPSISVGNNKELFVLWSSSEPDGKLRYGLSKDNGLTWEINRLDVSGMNYPVLLVDKSNILNVFCWGDSCRSIDFGKTWWKGGSSAYSSNRNHNYVAIDSEGTVYNVSADSYKVSVYKSL